MSRKHITINEDVWAELQKLKGEYRVSSFSEVLRRLLKDAGRELNEMPTVENEKEVKSLR
jgi:predicted CopG family antitoxin